ncbi:MAG: hypothetical protein NWQ13_04410, partial [Glaciimonas sp.]|nr:hypothetical protein [Glaciimonas sp.]
MNACKISLLLAAILSSYLVSAQQTLQLTVTGTLIASTCDVHIDDQNQTVTLDPVTQSEMS